MKHLRILSVFLIVAVMALSFVACNATPDVGDEGGSVGGSQTPSGNNTQNTPSGGNTQTQSGGGSQTPSGNEGENQTPNGGDTSRILVVYFSCTNTTKGRAEALQAKLGADIYRITPAVPYTNADLNYNTDCRANREQNDSSARPAISGGVEDMSQYDVIYIGYPIWWGQAPKIIYTFLESYDFAGKTLIPFCTSGGSGMGTSGNNLHSSAPNAIWKSGRRVSSNSDIDALVNMK